MEDEFRLLTLQVIGEAILSLGPEECDRVRAVGRQGSGHRILDAWAPSLCAQLRWISTPQVFPALYLPVMEESNRRVLQPWRYLYPLTVARYNANVKALNSYIVGIIRARRQARLGNNSTTDDILDRILISVEVRAHAGQDVGSMGMPLRRLTFP